MDALAVTLEDVLAATRAVARRLAAGEDAEAAAWRLRDRAAQARAHRMQTAQAHPLFGDGSLAAAAAADEGRHRPAFQPGCALMLRAASAVCRVLGGEAPRPGAAEFT